MYASFVHFSPVFIYSLHCLYSIMHTFNLFPMSHHSVITASPLLSAPAGLLSGVGNMSSKPHDTLCLPPNKQEGEPGPPSSSNSLQGNNSNCNLSLKLQYIYLHHTYTWPLIVLKQHNIIICSLYKNYKSFWSIRQKFDTSGDTGVKFYIKHYKKIIFCTFTL